MGKDFKKWSTEKKRLHESATWKTFYEQQVWWCSLGINIGYEEDGKHSHYERPVLVIKKFNKDVLWILPLTHTYKNNKYYYQLMNSEDSHSSVILSQIRLISSKRLKRFMYKVSSVQFKEILSLVKNILPR
jgi:mRNA interferase MazF